MLGRRGPGLIGAAARTAVIAGTATAVSGRVAARQHQQAMEAQAQMDAQVQAQMAPPPAPPVPPPAAAAADDTMAQLQQLAAMKAEGLLTDAEFAAAKARLLGL